MRAAFIRPQFYSEDELVLYGLCVPSALQSSRRGSRLTLCPARTRSPRPDEIAAIDLSNASYYFFSPSAADADSPFKPVPTDVGSTDDGRLSWSDAHAALVQLGCTRLGPSPAGQPVFSTAAAGGGTDKALEAGLVWTRNHWELVLWKLACLCRARPPLFFSLPSAAAAAADVDDGEAEVEGMVRRGSESESEAEVEGVGGRWRKGLERADGAGGGQGKFGWDEMMRQLLYRCVCLLASPPSTRTRLTRRLSLRQVRARVQPGPPAVPAAHPRARLVAGRFDGPVRLGRADASRYVWRGQAAHSRRAALQTRRRARPGAGRHRAHGRLVPHRGRGR